MVDSPLWQYSFLISSLRGGENIGKAARGGEEVLSHGPLL